MIKSWMALGCLVAVLTQCDRANDRVKTVEIPPSVKLTHTVRPVDVDLLVPSRIFIHKGKLIVFEHTRQDLFKVFDLQTFRHLYSFGDVGRANNEFIFVGSDEIIPSEDVEVFDTGKLKYVTFGDSAATIRKTRTLPLKKMAMPVNRFQKINDSIYYFDHAYDPEDPNEYVIMNIRTGKQASFSPYPEWIAQRVPDMQRYVTYLKSSRYNARQNRIAAFYYNFPAMKILDASDGSLISEIRMQPIADFSYKDPGKDRTFFAEPFVTDRFIYVLWVNVSKREIEREQTKFHPHIFVFNWEGELVHNYELDVPAIIFTVSEAEHKLYCISIADTNAIYEYPLPEETSCVDYAVTETDYYTVELPSNWTLPQRSTLSNRISEMDGYRGNVNYFIQREDGPIEKDYTFGSLRIGLCEPMKEADPEASPLRQFSGELLEKVVLDAGGTPVERTLWWDESMHPINGKEISYVLAYGKTVGNTQVLITLHSKKQDFGTYDAILEHAVKSFVLKRPLEDAGEN